MKYKKIYLASSNKQKLDRLQRLFQKIDKNISIEPYFDIINIEESGKTSMENALQKLEPYLNKEIKYPILTTDTALFFNKINFDSTKVKGQTLKEKGLKESDLNQEEVYQIMLNFYKNLAKEKGGELEFYFIDSWSLLLPNGKILKEEYKREYILTNKEVGEKQLYFPLCNLYKSKITGKYRTTWNENDFFLELKKQSETMKKLFSI